MTRASSSPSASRAAPSLRRRHAGLPARLRGRVGGHRPAARPRRRAQAPAPTWRSPGSPASGGAPRRPGLEYLADDTRLGRRPAAPPARRADDRRSTRSSAPPTRHKAEAFDHAASPARLEPRAAGPSSTSPPSGATPLHAGLRLPRRRESTTCATATTALGRAGARRGQHRGSGGRAGAREHEYMSGSDGDAGRRCAVGPARRPISGTDLREWNSVWSSLVQDLEPQAGRRRAPRPPSRGRGSTPRCGCCRLAARDRRRCRRLVRLEWLARGSLGSRP